MRIQVLGPVRAWRDNGDQVDLGPVGQRAVLGLLALNGGQGMSRADLIDAVWGQRPPASAVNILQTRVKHLRRLLEPDRPPRAGSIALPRAGDGYALRITTDLTRFRKLATASDAHVLKQALDLWHGPPLADIPTLADHPAVLAVSKERQAAIARYGEMMISLGSAAEALSVLEEVATEQPLDEAVQARLIRAYQAAGRRAQAFEVFHAIRRRLADELGVVPGPELTAAHEDVLHEDIPVTASRPVPNQLPADVPGFTGRGTELSEMDDRLAGPGMPICVISGTAGVGKTALAIHSAHRIRKRFPDGQLYVDLQGYSPGRPVTALDALGRFLNALGVPGAEVSLDVADRASRFRTELAGRRMLVVLDNANSVEQIRPLLPGTESCAVIVTSRDSLAGLVALHGAHRLDLDLLPAAEAQQLLRDLIGADSESIVVLAEQCARLPLALRVAAELAISRSGPLHELVRELVDQQRRLEILDAGGDDRAAVRAVFSRSYEHLPVDSARAFRLIGIHPGARVDPYVLAALTDASLDDARRTLDQLARAHLTQPDGSTHDLLKAYAVQLADQEDSPDERKAALVRVFDYYLAASMAAMHVLHPKHHDDPGPHIRPLSDAEAAREWLDTELPTLIALSAYGWPSYTTKLATTLQRYLDGGRYAEALVIHGHALKAADNPTDRAHALTNLGTVLWRAARYSDSADHLTQALELYRQQKDLSGQARVLTNLGVVEERLSRYEQAEDHQRRALAIYHELGDQLGEVQTHVSLGIIDERRGKFSSAAEHLSAALELCRTIGYTSGEAYALLNLGYVDKRMEHYTAAREHFSQAMDLFKQLGERRGEAYALTNLGELDVRRNQPQLAIDRHLAAIALFGEVGEQRGLVTALNGLGEALFAAGRNIDARARYTAALSLAVETGDEDEEARAHNGLAHTYRQAGDTAQARDHWEKALELYTKLDDPQAENVRAQLS
ncbi:tetratricopeptide repeat protein [Kibdelosporangium aridum]|uniref:Tetratricopeptide repeat protein n=1 Tax=Kibdelosporangium aridum TaxID=2030 RepID=A0A428YYJ4_KIBAR|nr:tetratricopeptide repeat protein [Kibdelosporangium aridum]RSM75899.1 tetratricopeptide repeat protein [Kibdelosporangium aridum]